MSRESNVCETCSQVYYARGTRLHMWVQAKLTSEELDYLLLNRLCFFTKIDEDGHRQYFSFNDFSDIFNQTVTKLIQHDEKFREKMILVRFKQFIEEKKIIEAGESNGELVYLPVHIPTYQKLL
ncbi:MAG: hypothetical protein HYX20_00990 [Candidatus Yanofskybacteria bacterium]|nr:hypothetical protein [Candidatus Yanofskybacteria bacterium]